LTNPTRFVNLLLQEVLEMPEQATKAVRPHTSPKLLKHMKEAPRVNVSLKDVQKSLSGTGVSLSKRVMEEREKR
jgi:hypothetical protein